MDRYADVQIWAAGDFVLGVVWLASMVLGGKGMGAISVAGFAGWNGWMLWRLLTKRNWMIAVGEEGIHIHLYSRNSLFSLLPAQSRPGTRILCLSKVDVVCAHVKPVDILWSMQRRTVLKALVLRLTPTAGERLACETKLHHGATLKADVQVRGQQVTCRWSLHPPIERFLKDVTGHGFQVIEAETGETLDVSRFGSSSCEEQERAVRRLRSQGFGAAAVLLLRRFRKMSTLDALRFLASDSDCRSGTDPHREPQQ